MVLRMIGYRAEGPPLTLVGAIDDATSKVGMAFFTQAETSWGYFHCSMTIFRQCGLPQSSIRLSFGLLDRPGSRRSMSSLRGKRPTTEVGRALEELGSH